MHVLVSASFDHLGTLNDAITLWCVGTNPTLLHWYNLVIIFLLERKKKQIFIWMFIECGKPLVKVLLSFI